MKDNFSRNHKRLINCGLRTAYNNNKIERLSNARTNAEPADN
ncbi:hypothetical protein ADICYQ_4880 [Cyclobacterium qasimii M12-11B]|uniref:Uncharacterized protein n=1 Tax=Cyclobacterium qasimii M12-11B TaxID=641524 RepID=S7V9E5_9BACT|nr:hypothetical protein ADICYQ_4880 [Cyclobacterium qasimii M12-11B]